MITIRHTRENETLYAPDFEFFLEHQIFVTWSKDRRKVSLCSQLEAVTFGNIVSYPETITDDDMLKQCREIHDHLKANDRVWV